MLLQETTALAASNQEIAESFDCAKVGMYSSIYRNKWWWNIVRYEFKKRLQTTETTKTREKKKIIFVWLEKNSIRFDEILYKFCLLSNHTISNFIIF